MVSLDHLVFVQEQLGSGAICARFRGVAPSKSNQSGVFTFVIVNILLLIGLLSGRVPVLRAKLMEIFFFCGDDFLIFRTIVEVALDHHRQRILHQ
jgi:hypothetical protein